MGLGRLVLFGFVVVAFFKMEKRREWKERKVNEKE
jgi:hypothetical protein